MVIEAGNPFEVRVPDIWTCCHSHQHLCIWFVCMCVIVLVLAGELLLACVVFPAIFAFTWVSAKQWLLVFPYEARDWLLHALIFPCRRGVVGYYSRT